MPDDENTYKIPCFILEYVSGGTIRHINDLLLEALGYSTTEVQEVMKFDQLLTPGSRIFYQMHFYPLIKMQGHAEEIFLSLKTKSGKEIPVIFNAVIESSGDKHIIRAAGIAISKRNTFEKALIEAKQVAEKSLMENELLIAVKKDLETNTKLLEGKWREEKRTNSEQKEVSKFLAHDLQEHLRKISLSANRIVANFSGAARHYAQRILDQNEKNRRLLNGIQYYYSLDQYMSQPVPLDLKEIINNALSDFNTTFNVDLKGLNASKIQGQPDYLSRLFKELIQNSIKFKAPHRWLQICISSELVRKNNFEELPDYYDYQDYILLHYEDNGIGFQPKYAEKAFRLMEKLEPNEGFGLGLAYAKKIVHLHKGLIDVNSQPGKGTVFRIFLPVQ